MIQMTNISKNGDVIRCNYALTDSTRWGTAVLDLLTGDFTELIKTDADENIERYASKVKYKLAELAKMPNIPEKRNIVWG